MKGQGQSAESFDPGAKRNGRGHLPGGAIVPRGNAPGLRKDKCVTLPAGGLSLKV